LGLSLSYGIIQKHGGTIEVESKQGEGTVFRIVLPVKHVEVETEIAS
jgi:signal transduction histidine kinase